MKWLLCRLLSFSPDCGLGEGLDLDPLGGSLSREDLENLEDDHVVLLTVDTAMHLLDQAAKCERFDSKDATLGQTEYDIIKLAIKRNTKQEEQDG